MNPLLQIFLGVGLLALAWISWKVIQSLAEKYDHKPEINYRALFCGSALMVGIFIAAMAGVVLIVGAVTNALCS
ncbi:MAG: hypothetical protein G01um101419_795 [Parcubacteria group bacterium Gr01-1014_19]|nr:MAG: hypothetical protein G01um101419_795 [Parcubacteria group bacterium Gr01-1014_19]